MRTDAEFRKQMRSMVVQDDARELCRRELPESAFRTLGALIADMGALHTVTNFLVYRCRSKKIIAIAGKKECQTKKG